MKNGILLMGYGSPESIEDVEQYLCNIKALHAQPNTSVVPTMEETERLEMRYKAIGGRSPFNAITERQSRSLSSYLKSYRIEAKVYTGMLHWKPSIEDAVSGMERDGVTDIIAIPMAPYYSTISTEGYRKVLNRCLARLKSAPAVSFVKSWNINKHLIKFWEDVIATAMQHSNTDAHIIFTAHSLPSITVENGDPYKDQFIETCTAITSGLGIKDWSYAFQSASGAGWLGPSIVDRLKIIASEGKHKKVVIAPIGFITDNLETLYDIDIECVAGFNSANMSVSRVILPNDSELLIEALTSIVKERVTKIS
jgi:ferrochelatase